MCTARLFAEGVDRRPLYTHILPGQGRPPINRSWRQETRDHPTVKTAYPILLRSLFLIQYRCVTDRWTDGYAVAYTAATALAKPGLRRAVIADFVILVVSLYLYVSASSGLPTDLFNIHMSAE